MATRRDQLQSYQFLLQRVVSALVYRKTDPAQSPFRKAGGAVFAGIMISILALAVTAVIGLFANGFGRTVDWKAGEAVVIDEDTGAQYVVFPKDANKDEPGMPEQRLYPVLNFTSAVLLAGTTEVFQVGSASLTGDGVPPRGMTIGISGAPDSLPIKENLVTSGWSVCSLLTSAGGNDRVTSYAYVGSQPDSGDTLSEEQALYVTPSSDEKQHFLVWNQHKFSISGDNSSEIRGKLQMTSDVKALVADAYLNALPDGGEIAAPKVEGLGEDTDVSGADKAGQVLRVDSGGEPEYYVALTSGAAPITEFQANLLVADPEVKELAYDNAEADFKSLESAPSNTTDSWKPSSSDPAAPPAELPEIAAVGDVDTATCAIYGGDGEASQVITGANITAEDGIATQQLTSEQAVLADRVVVPPGKGALVQSGGPNAEAGALVLVTDSGRTYPLGDPSVVETFGYDNESMVKVYSGLVNMLPPGLDPGVALSIEAAQANAFNAK